MWYIDENLGLYNSEFLPVPRYAVMCPVSPAIWHIDPFSNSGFPFCDLMIGIPRLRIKVVDQDPYVSVFDVSTKNKEDFNGNGHAILCPTECIVHQVLNGEYSVRLTHPMDDDGKWTYIRERNYLKVLGQIFTIISVDSDYDMKQVTAYAEHIFYQLCDAWIFRSWPENNRQITGNNGQEVLNDIMVSATYYSPPDMFTVFTFQYYSDIPDLTYFRDVRDGCTPVDAILGDGGLVDVTGGKLYRDNFYFSVNAEMEDSDSNAFDIRVGCNLHGIKRKIDTATMASWFAGYDNFGNFLAVSWSPSSFPINLLPHNIVRTKNFDFEFTTDNMRMLSMLVFSYFEKYCSPIISYTFDIADSINNPVYADIEKMYSFEVGDSGQLYDERLGGSLHLTINETEKDGITGKTLRFSVGNSRSFVRSGSPPPSDIPQPQIEQTRFVWRDKNGVILVDKNGAVLHTEVNRNGN